MNAGKMIKGYLAAIASAVIFGCMPLMARYIYADGVNSLTLVFLRNFLALPALAIMAYRQSRTLKIPGKVLPKVFLTSLFGGCITPVLLFSSYSFLPSGAATVFHFVYPALVVLSSILLKKEPMRWGNLVSVALCFFGICLFYTPGQPLDWRGSLLALSSGVTYTVYVILLADEDLKKIPCFLFCFCLAAMSSIMMFLLCVTTGQLALPQSLNGWLLSALFAMGVTCGAMALFQIGTFLVGGQQTSILSTLEPITSVVVGVVVFHEVMNLRTFLGVALVVCASALIPLSNLGRSKKEQKNPAEQ